MPAIAAGLAAAIPVMSSTIRAVQAGWVPAGDDGIIATRGWDVLTSHTPLIGQYSEAGLMIHGQVMHSPGPMLYWLIALPERFGSVTSIAVTMGIANTLAIVGAVALARRRGGLILMFATAAGIALMCQSLPAEAMHDIWNPAAGLFGFLLLIFLGWSLACDEHRLLPITVLVASYVTQTHLMYVAPTAMVLTVGCGGLLIRSLARRRAHSAGQEPPPPRIWPWALAALVVAAACWTEPAIDQIENSPGNLAMIVHTAEHRGPKLGATVGWHAVVRSVGVRPWWLHVPTTEWERKADVRATPSSSEIDSTIALLAALALAGLIGAVRRRWDLAAATLIGLGLCAAIGVEAAFNPSYDAARGNARLHDVVGLGAGALGLADPRVGAVARAGGSLATGARGAAPTPAPARPRTALPSWTRLAVVVLASLASLGGVAIVGSAVAASAKPDSHAYEYRPIRAVAAGIERLIPPGQTHRISPRTARPRHAADGARHPLPAGPPR